MKSTVSFDKKTGTPKGVKLELTKEEAQWLRAVVQNPLCGDPADEPGAEKTLRHKFFTAVEPFTAGTLI